MPANSRWDLIRRLRVKEVIKSLTFRLLMSYIYIYIYIYDISSLRIKTQRQREAKYVDPVEK